MIAGGLRRGCDATRRGRAGKIVKHSIVKCHFIAVGAQHNQVHPTHIMPVTTASYTMAEIQAARGYRGDTGLAWGLDGWRAPWR